MRICKENFIKFIKSSFKNIDKSKLIDFCSCFYKELNKTVKEKFMKK